MRSLLLHFMGAFSLYLAISSGKVSAQGRILVDSAILAKLPTEAILLTASSNSVKGKKYTAIKYLDQQSVIHGRIFREDGIEVSEKDAGAEAPVISNELRRIIEGQPNAGTERIKVAIALNLPAGETEVEDCCGGVFRFGSENQVFDGTKATGKEYSRQKTTKEAKSDARRMSRRAAKKLTLQTLESRFEAFKPLNLEQVLDEQEESVVLSLLPGQIMEIAASGDELVAGIEPALEARAEIATAVYATGIAQGVLNTTGHPQGSGIGVNLVESAGCPDPGFLPNYTRVNGTAEFHSEMVAFIARYVSPQNKLRCRKASSTTSGLPTSTDLSSGMYVLNGSFGFGPTGGGFYDDGLYRTYDRDWDNFVYSNWIASFKSAGNTGGSNGFLTSPGQGLNVLSVGNFDYSNFTIVGGSSYRNPETKNMKPEIVAPGENITAAGYTNGGTSLSSPHAAGFASNLISQYPQMILRPHLLRAAMITGASLVVSGGTDRVGVGGINYLSTAPLMVSTQASGPVINAPFLEGGNNAWSTFDANDWGGTSGKVEVLVSGMQPGQSYRLAIAWVTRGSYTYANRTAAHPIGIDLDIELYDHANQFLGSSASYDNSFEYIDFTATTFGPYILKISRFANRDTNCKLEIGVWASPPGVLF